MLISLTWAFAIKYFAIDLRRIFSVAILVTVLLAKFATYKLNPVSKQRHKTLKVCHFNRKAFVKMENLNNLKII